MKRYRTLHSGLILAALAASPVAEPAGTSQLPAEPPRPEAEATGDSASEESSSGVPPGFETLMLEQESLVDVYYGGLLITTTMARFSPNEITFSDPAAITQRVPDLLDPERFKSALSGSLPTHQAMICHHKGQAQCGTLNPDSAAVIFNADRFRADLFVNPTLLAVRQLSMNKFLPPSTAGWSFLQTFNYAFGGTNADLGQNSNLFMLSALAYRENSLRMSANYTNNEYFNIQNFFLQRDWQGQRYQGGYFLTQTQDLRFSGGTDLAAVRIGTTLDTRDDLRLSSGNLLNVFLLSRGEVSLFKDGRLITTQIYDAGNQTIDTSALPGGSYDIEIRINDSGGERVERRFYVKNSFLPPPDMPLYFLEVGEITRRELQSTLPALSGEYLARGGINYRLNDANALIGSLSGTTADTAAELGWFGLGSGYELRLSGAVAQSGRYGVNTDFRTGFKQLFVTANYRRIWNHSGRYFEVMDLIGEEQVQSYLNVSAPTRAGRFSANARYNSRPLLGSVRSLTLGYEANAWRLASGDLRLRVDITRENDLHQGLLTLQWRNRWNRWNASVTPQYVYREFEDYTDSFPRGDAQLNWDSQGLGAQDVRAGVRAVKDKHFGALGADGDWRGRFGQARYQIEQRFTDEGNPVLQNGTLATNFVIAEGETAFGGRDQNQSAIVVDLTGTDSEDALFDVLIDGSRRASVRPGTRTVISVRPFESYTVRLHSRGSEFIYFDDREHHVSLYPGNVVYLNWDAAAVDIILGRIVDAETGEPIANALLEGVMGLSVSDDFGLFQAEIEQGTSHLRVKTRSGQCQITLPEYKPVQGVGSVGVLRCDLAAEPPDEN